MTNDFSNIPSDNEFTHDMTIEPNERNPAYDGPMGIFTDYEGCNTEKNTNEGFDSHLEMAYEDRTHVEDTEETVDGGWPGDGSGMDDLADYNANEADDYRDE